MLAYFGSLASAGRVTGYAATIDGLPGGPPLGHWRLGEVGGTQIRDWKAGTRHGTYAGTIGYGAAGLPQDSDGAVDFGGVGSGSVPHDAGLALPAFSLSFWFKTAFIPGDTDFAMPLVSKDDSAANTNGDFVVYLPQEGGGSLRVRFRDGVGIIDLTSPQDVIQAQTTHHVVVRADNTGFDLYVDGVYHGKSTGYLSAWSANTAAILFATNPGFSGVGNCVIDEVALYSRVLTEAEVLQLAQRTSLPVAVNDAAGVPESATTPIDVIDNDSFVGTPTIAIVSQPGGGDSVAVSGQVISYTAGAVTQDTARSFTYRIIDPNGQSNTATVNVTVQDPSAPQSGQANCYVISGADTVEVNSAAALETAANAAPPGRQILVAPGTYAGGNRTFDFGGTAANPVVVRARDGRGTVTFNDATWTIDGTYGVFADLYFNGAKITIDGAVHPRFTRCRFRQINRTCFSIVAGTDGRLDHLDFSDWISSTAVKRCVEWLVPGLNNGATKRWLVDYCYFHDINPAQGVNGCNIFSCGTGGAFSASGGIVLDHCLLRNIEIPGEAELIGVKSSEVTVRFTTIENCNQYLQQRQGGGWEVRSCWFEGNTGGQNAPIHAFDDDYITPNKRTQLVIGNRVIGGGDIWVGAGSGPAVAGPNGVYHASIGGRFIGNRVGTGQILVGETWTQQEPSQIAAQNNNLHANTRDAGGNVHVIMNATGTTFNTDNEPFVAAVKLAPADVGLAALDPLCSSGPQS